MRRFSPILAAAAILAVACGDVTPDVAAGPPEPDAAVALLHPTRGNDASGSVRFTAAGDRGLRVVADLSGLAPGLHAYHVHVDGDCTAPDASSAGAHFEFVARHGAAPAADRIAGNLGEIEADESGRGHAEGTIETARLAGPRSIVGRAVVVHARGNDPESPPGGDAGPRVACGVIGRAES